MRTKIIIIVLVSIVVLGGGIFVLSKPNATTKTQTASNVSIADGKQVITINAKGGYFPRTTQAKANMPTILKFSTQGTFDCSSSINIPSLGYRNNLPASGETTVDVTAQKPGSSLTGTCAMGMYNFVVNFN